MSVQSDLTSRSRKAPASSSSAPKAIVIGSGFGGLAAAVRLLVRGYKVTVLEKLAEPGGRAMVRKREGFTFDSGPTVITAPFLFEELWELAGERMQDHIDMRPVTPFYRIRFDDGTLFDYTGDPEAMRSEVARLCPSDVEGYERFVAESEKIFAVGFEKLAHVPFGNFWDMAKIVPEMVRLKSYRSVYSMVSSHLKDERLRQVMSFHPLLVGGNPFSTTSIYTLIAFLERKWGVHFPIGGTGALVNGLIALIGRLGGEVRCSSGVKQITHNDRRAATGVLLEDGTRMRSDIVVSNADSAWTYKNLVHPSVRTKWTDRKLENSKYSMGLFVWYFGTNRQYPDVAHHTICLGPRYEELLRDIFDRKIVAKDFSLYLHRPTATDPSLAPAGKDAFYVLSPVPHLDSGTDWKTFGETYRKRIETMLESTLLPGLSKELAVSEFITPQTFFDDLSSYKGAAFGIEPILTQSAYFRPHNASEELKNLFLVGAGTHPGAGMPGVLSSARVLDQTVPDPSTFVSAS
jgi:phytoene desaturase